jgi:hypothetical protein
MGLHQRTIAALLGRSEQWVSRGIQADRPPVAIRLAILDWELRRPGERAELLEVLGLVRVLFRQPLA